MSENQQINQEKIYNKATVRERIKAGIVFLFVLGLFVVLWLAGTERVDPGYLIGPCGFKADYGWPCPTCGITTSAVSFAKGRILESFYIQPAGGLFCIVLVVVGFLAFLMGVFGVYFRFLRRFFIEVKLRYIILSFIVIIVGGWAVTLARALAAKNSG